MNGVVVDEAGRPVARRRSWAAAARRTGWTSRAVVEATTAADGTFQLEGIQPGAKVAALWARHGHQATVESLRARAGRADRLTLRVFESGTLAITGRVVGPDGRPVAGAVVNVFHRTPYAGGNGAYGGRVRFDNSAEVRTGPDGTYRTPSELRPGVAYRVKVAAAAGPRRWARSSNLQPAPVRPACSQTCSWAARPEPRVIDGSLPCSACTEFPLHSPETHVGTFCQSPILQKYKKIATCATSSGLRFCQFGHTVEKIATCASPSGPRV